jgi:hypothetical protein
VHGHINQINANIQMNAVYEAQQAAAKQVGSFGRGIKADDLNN